MVIHMEESYLCPAEIASQRHHLMKPALHLHRETNKDSEDLRV